MEDGLRDRKDKEDAGKSSCVLILVVMEDGLRDLLSLQD